MANQRKLGRTADQRKALLRNQVTNLIWYGRIETTISKAKEVRRIADKMITLAVRECDNTVSTTKETHNDKGQLVTLDVVNDAPSKLHARRIMMAYLYDLKEEKKADENKADYKERTKVASSLRSPAEGEGHECFPPPPEKDKSSPARQKDLCGRVKQYY